MAHFFRLVRRQMAIQLRIRTFDLYNLLLFFIQPAVFSGVGMLLSKAAGQETPDLVYTVLGGGIMGMWSGLVFSSTYDIRRDRREGILELIVGSRTSLHMVEGIRTFANVMAGLVSMLTALVVAVLIFKYPLQQINLPAALISLLLILFALWCLGMFLANLQVCSRLTSSIVDFIETPIAVLCGFMYPIRILPVWMQFISAVLPIRWALEALDASLLGNGDLSVLWPLWGTAFGISLLFLLLAYLLERKVHNLIRVTGEFNSI